MSFPELWRISRPRPGIVRLGGPLGSEGGHRVRCSAAGQEAVAALGRGLSEPEGWWATGKVTE